MKISLVPAKLEDLDTVLQMQLEAFAELLDRYQDFDTNPGNERYEDILRRFNQTGSIYYFIVSDDKKIGVIRIVGADNSKSKKRISPIFIMPKYRNKGYAQRAIKEVEHIHGKNGWSLETILQEKGNCHLYEKVGYEQTDTTIVINDKMTLVIYEKD